MKLFNIHVLVLLVILAFGGCKSPAKVQINSNTPGESATSSGDVILSGNGPKSFKTLQLTNKRVKVAYTNKEKYVQNRFQELEIPYPASQIFLRVYKAEAELDVWVMNSSSKSMQLFKSYPICAASGDLGPKREEGDEQVPEGVYFVDRFNPNSSYHVALGLNYPNALDKIWSGKRKPGFDIFIHGHCASIGCMAMTDPLIEEIYILAVEAYNLGQKQIPVHIFPRREMAKNWAELQDFCGKNSELCKFWETLAAIESSFLDSDKHPLPVIELDVKNVTYKIKK